MRYQKLLAAAAALLISVCAQAAVTVTTGGGYVKMVEALVGAYQKETGQTVQTAFGGNIGQMLSQVQSGSPVTVVISDAVSLKRFAAKLDAAKGVELGKTPLILAWRKSVTITKPEDLTGAAIKKVALPDPKAAVYGRAADEYLKSSGLAQRIAAKLNVVSTVPQVQSYLAQGEMDAGFINLLAARQGKDKLGGFMAIEGGFEPIVMVAQPVVGEAGQAADVRQFLDWLASPKVDAMLDKFGVSRK